MFAWDTVHYLCNFAILHITLWTNSVAVKCQIFNFLKQVRMKQFCVFEKQKQFEL